VEIKSDLPATDYQYLYFSRRFTPAELNVGNETFHQMEADAHLSVHTVFLFDHANKKKISHTMQPAGTRHRLSLPSGTASVRFALRIQGSGTAILGKLTLAESHDLPSEVLPSARHLVVATHYPSYEDLYRFGFVHARVRAYARAGVVAQILRISTEQRVVYREFENIDVIQADADYLEQCLAGGYYSSILVHIITQNIWNILRKYLDRVRLVIWVHGAEIQPWWRRAVNYTTDASRDQARRSSDARMAMWREIFSLHHPNLRVVFISRKQAAEALSDLQLTAAEADGVEIISHFIDGDLFRYQAKDPELRHRLLSIRPYASRVYANDLTVAAILRLAKEPFFNQLHFRIVGDGVLFDETVAPLRDFPNVQIERTFLTQHEIATLHRDYGVFLVPSRMDSQGVSRDEAMASGLVPITNRVAAIPEFVDRDCAFLAEPEDAAGLADAVRQLHEDPALFSRMSAAAARRVRERSGFAQTIARELALFVGDPATLPRSKRDEHLVAAEVSATRIAVYGDVNLNIMDGSAIWAASLAEVLAGIEDVRVTLILKARIHRTQVITRLLDMAPAVQLIEPEIPPRIGLTPAEAIARLVALDAKTSFHGIILRGLDVCHTAAQEAALRGRLWAYLTDIPQKAELMDAATRQRIETIIDASAYVLCQTPQLRSYFVSQFPQACEKTRLLPPMIPPLPARAVESVPDAPFRFVYAGKFAPRWGIRELFAAQKKLLSLMPDAELHVFGDKIHNLADDPSFYPTVKENLATGKGITWHGAVDRDELLRCLTGMHACWAYRDPTFERETLELSTKVLEYASLGLPIILARSQVFEELLGVDYPLFATSGEEACNLLLQLARVPAFRKVAAARLEQAAAGYTFAAVRKRLLDDGLIPRSALGGDNSPPPPSPSLKGTS
jgi:glycosyltransferase involved in cell wall biosynthesis